MCFTHLFRKTTVILALSAVTQYAAAWQCASLNPDGTPKEIFDEPAYITNPGPISIKSGKTATYTIDTQTPATAMRFTCTVEQVKPAGKSVKIAVKTNETLSYTWNGKKLNAKEGDVFNPIIGCAFDHAPGYLSFKVLSEKSTIKINCRNAF